jgi:DsbC/DsbD-like thiol-disulfide interchange protein
MNTTLSRLRRLIIVACVILACIVTFSAQARAADASEWSADAHSQVRLIVGAPQTHPPSVLAGVEVKLDPGWKTYWRYPGDSGVPPRFDFSRSENIKSVTVQWPVPHHFVDETGNSIGYKDHVIFPLRLIPQDPTKPILLHLKLDYATCEKLCIPATGEGTLRITGDPSTHAGELEAAEAQVPVPAKLGDQGAVAIRAVHREHGAKFDRVIVDVAAPASDSLDLFAEGPTADWALPLPAPIAPGPSGLRRFGFDLDGVPPGAKVSGADLTFTLVAGKAAIEVVARVD